MSKELFFEMKAEQMVTMYPADFTKFEAQKQGVKLVTDVLDAGDIDKMEFAANLARITDVLTSAMTELRKHLPDEKITVMGVRFTPKNGGARLNYEEDARYVELKTALEQRAALLKLAQKQETTDPYNNYDAVPKVGVTYTKDSITIEY